MITIQQCRAARGLLGWTQQDLADACGLSKTAINNYEKGHSEIKADSLRAIQLAFESVDVEFTKNQGVRQRVDHAAILSGEPCFEELLHDIMASQLEQPLLISNLHESAIERIGGEKLIGLIEKLLKKDIKTKIIYAEGTPHLKVSAQQKNISISQSAYMPLQFIYAQKNAIQFYDHNFITVIDSAPENTRQRQKFAEIWDSAISVAQTSEENSDAKTAS